MRGQQGRQLGSGKISMAVRRGMKSPPIRIDRSDDENATIAQHAPGFLDHPFRLAQVIQRLEEQDEVEGPIGEIETVDIHLAHDHLGMIVLHEEVNEEQGIVEAMLSVRGAPMGSTQLQLMAPIDDSSAIAKFLDKRGPGMQQLAYRTSDIDTLSKRLRAQGIRLIYDSPRRGTANSRINFIHPKDGGGVLIELVEASADTH